MGSSADWNADIVYVLRLYKHSLRILGLWVLDKESVCSRIRWFLATMIEISTTITLSLEVIRHCHGHEDTLEAFLIATSSVTSIAKLLLHRVNWRDKLLLVETVIHDWNHVKDSYSRDIMLKYARRGKHVSLVLYYLGCVSCVSATFSILPVDIKLPWIGKEQIDNSTSERKLILAAYCIFGGYTSVTYGFIEALQLVQILVNSISQCANDGLFFGLTMHMCGQFEILRVDFAELNGDGLLCHEQLGTLLKRHRRLIRLGHTLEKAFSLVILAQLLMSVVLICVEGFQLILSLTMHNTLIVMKHIVFITILLVQLFLYCSAGQTLEHQSEELAYAIYTSPWYTFDVSVIKNLPLIIFRAAIPHQLTAGKFLAMNFMSFKEILKASASYLSVLRVMLET